jgi:NAD(P)-dependent dehydrogenase (short-subunit alcohol dehydrogenase family)
LASQRASQQERSVLVTGASRGFGRMIAATLAGAGYRVFATMRDPRERAGLDAALDARGADPAGVRVLALDVLDQGSIAAALSSVLAVTGGRLDALVANAGIAVVGAFEDTPPGELRRVMETNFFGATETVRAALPALRAAHGRIVLISSDSGIYGSPALSAYAASKHALEGFGESLAYEVGPLGVSVSIVEPGAFRTELWDLELQRSAVGPYARFAELAECGWREAGRAAPPPDAVAQAVLRALAVPRPRLRYPVGADARRSAALRRLLPDALFARLVRRSSGLEAWRP